MNDKKNNDTAHDHSHDEQEHAATTDALDTTDQSLPAGVSASDIHQDGGFSVARTLANKRILVTGSTGFLAKVLVSMLLRFHPDIEQLYVVIRDRSTAKAPQRFQEELVECGAFDPLHEIYGEGLNDFLKEKVTVLSGDITSRFFGLEEDEAEVLAKKLDVIINSAGLTNFNPNLSHALEINTLSERNILEFLELGDYHPALLHISTCFVAGNTTTPSPEELPTPEVYPRYDELGTPFDVEREIEDCMRMIIHAKELAEDQENSSAIHQDTLDLLKKRNLDPENEQYYKSAYREMKNLWIKNHLSYRGRDRAAHWGWPNIYTYTKSMGERLLSAHQDKINFSILRPAIVESSMSYPMPGWNEGVNTSAPLVYLRLKGHRYYPTKPVNTLDIVPVDYVCGAMLGVAAALIEKRAKHVYQIGSSDMNPFHFDRIIELTSLAVRKLRQNEVNTPTWKKVAMNSFEGIVVPKSKYDARSAPAISKFMKGVRTSLQKIPTKSLGGVGKAIKGAERTVHGLEKATGTMDKMFEIFMPFIYHNRYTFIAKNIGALGKLMPEHERAMYSSPVEDYNWRHYWIDVHVPGLNRHVFPQLEEKLRSSPKKTYTYEDLVDLFDSSTRNYAKRIALQHHDGRLVERYTYEELGNYAEHVSLILKGHGVQHGVAAMLIAENRPQWAMSYFGILKAGGIAVPMDPDSTPEKIARLAARSRARVLILSDAKYNNLKDDIQKEFETQDHTATILSFADLFRLQLTTDLEQEHTKYKGEIVPSIERTDTASLIFTSGTTGAPKGVMLTHQNFTNMLHSVQQVFPRVNERDGFLSVLPLHHTFEFTCGLIMPISRGSSITYIEELNADELTSALKNTKITALIGVPALWQLLFKRIDQRLADAPPVIRWTIKQLMFLNRTAREKLRINVGPALFVAIHKAFGGRIKYFISGGAALPADILKAFYSMGFNMYEGYGLTEAAPVLTVNRPDKGLLPGSVGRALPGIEVQIHKPNDEGVGEVIARGKNVMAGYLDLEDATKRSLKDGWLHTGDLGKLDDKGNLTIVGRAKDVIITHGGKNVYPDELEELYGTHPLIEEISVVGLEDGRGSERVAALVNPLYDEDTSDEEHMKIRTELREWFRVEGSRVPAHERIQVLRFWDDELPRTATRKIKRTAVIDILTRLLEAEEKAHAGEEHDSEWIWLDRIIGNLCDYDADKIFPSMHFLDDLGFDSLMLVELGSILDAKGYHIPPEQMSRAATVEDLRDIISGKDNGTTAMVHVPQGTLARVDEYDVPQSMSKFGKNLLYQAQMRSYGDFFDVEVYGRANIPQHDPNIIVIANHSSHLDMGLVKYALGEFGNNIRALAAADYFYKDKLRKTYFKNFTNLIPLERSGNLETSLGHAVKAIKKGEMLLIFPEGTRSKTGKLQPFKKGLGYLVASQKVNVLPIFIEGTYRAFPKGAKLPSLTSRHLKVFIGKPLDAFKMLEQTKDAPNTVEQYQQISDIAHQAIVDLRDRKKNRKKGPQAIDLAPVFMSLNEKFIKAQLDSKVSYYFSISDDDKWTITVDSDKCNVAPGKPSGGKADCVIKTSPEIVHKMIMNSYVPSFDEFMNGTIKTNSPDLLIRFQSVFQL